MNPGKYLAFLLQAVMAGLALAFVLLMLNPEWIRQPPPVINVTEIPDSNAVPEARTAGNTGPVSYASAVERAAPAVVNIHTARIITRQSHPLLDDPVFHHFFGNRFKRPQHQLQTSLGSGVLISNQGYVLTSNHVIDGADDIQVLLADGRRAHASVVGVDLDTDLAVLHVHLEDLPAIIIGNSTNLRVGDVVLAIGNPFGVGQTVTQGIISAKGRDRLGISAYEDFIQTDAAINPGNSGGALVNAHGELVGINSAIYSRSGGSQGVGFAIPVRIAKDVLKQIIEQGHVVRGWLGIEAQDITHTLADSYGLDGTEGVLISGVMRDGPADQAGLEPGDVITAIGEKRITDARDAMNTISIQAPDSLIDIKGERKGKPFTTRARVGQRPVPTR